MSVAGCQHGSATEQLAEAHEPCVKGSHDPGLRILQKEESKCVDESAQFRGGIPQAANASKLLVMASARRERTSARSIHRDFIDACGAAGRVCLCVRWWFRLTRARAEIGWHGGPVSRLFLQPVQLCVVMA